MKSRLSIFVALLLAVPITQANPSGPDMKALWQRLTLAWQIVVNRYEGAAFSSSRSIIPAAVQSARFDAGFAQRVELVRKARYFRKNSALFTRMNAVYQCYTVGSRLQITPASTIDPEYSKRQKIEFDAWCQRCDFNGRANLTGLFRQGMGAKFVDGEGFIYKTRLDPKKLNSEPRLQVFEGHLVGTPPSLAALEGESIVDGFVLDGEGRRIACYIAREDSRGGKIYGPPTDLKHIIHLGEAERPGMERPFPPVAPVINKLHDCDDLEVLEMKAAKEAARHINFITNATGEISQDALRQAGYNVGTKAVTTTAGGTVDETRRDYYQDSLGGETIVGRTGDKMERLSSNRPTVVVMEYWKMLKADICAAHSIPYVLVYPESMQGTVYRGALDMADAFFAAEFEMNVARAARDVFKFWADWARYAIPTLRDPPADYANCTVHQPCSVNVDVGRNNTAMLQRLAAGAATYEEVYGPEGSDWKERFDRLAEQQQYAKDKGIVITFPGQPAQPEAAPQPT